VEAALHGAENQRLAALHRYEILDTPREQEFDDIVAVVSAICETPISVINLIDEGRQWFKAEVGLGVRETPLPASICAHAILQRGLFVVPDTLEDVRFADNPLVTGDPGLRFYAGALLETSAARRRTACPAPERASATSYGRTATATVVAATPRRSWIFTAPGRASHGVDARPPTPAHFWLRSRQWQAQTS